MRTHTPSKIWNSPDGYHRELLKNPWYRSVAQLQSTVSELTTSFWAGRSGVTLHLPVTTGSISSPMGAGSDSSPVEIDLLGARTYLADSMQFMLELGCRLTDSDTYYVMPSFRGEDTDASHLSQFFHSEAEIRGGLDDVIEVVQDYLQALAAGLVRQRADLIRSCGGDIARVEALAGGRRFQRITFDEAAALCPSGVTDVGAGARGLSRAGERAIMDELGEFVWVTEWDHLSVPFYQAFTDETHRRARNADLLFGLGEVVGSGERHATAEQVNEALRLHEVDPVEYGWYCEMREHEPLRTAGFGMGVERFLMWVLDHDDIRDLQLLPRRNGYSIVP